MMPPSTPPQAGRLLYFLQEWKQLTQDPWVLDTVKGYKIPFVEIPPSRQIPAFTFSVAESTTISMEVKGLLDKQAIVQVASSEGFVSNVFLVPKGGSRWRLILNLKALNVYTEHKHFKMEDIRGVKDLLSRGEYMCKLDLKDAYLSVPISPSHQKYLQFRWEGKLYQYKVLPFGLATAPRAFTKLLKPVLAHLRKGGMRLIAYLDDLLIIGKSKKEAEKAYLQTKALLESLGFVVNLEKSQALGTQTIEFLGFIINSARMTFKLPQTKVQEIRKECRQALREEKLTVRRLAHIVGTLSAARLAVTPAPLHYRGLQASKIEGLLHHLSYESTVSLKGRGRKDLEWWVDHLKDHNGSPIHQAPPELVIESDASNTGWGARWNDQRTGGRWTAEESKLHINAKELLAAFLALRTFARHRQRIHVHLKIDNATAVYYINRMGGTHSRALMELAAEMWEWSLCRNIVITAEHLPGRLNTVADQESRMRGDSSEWILSSAVFRRVMAVLGPCQVDLFASRLSAQLPQYMSWKLDPGSIATDALSQSWKEIKGYAFPPFSLIGRCLSKIKREEVPELILVAPVWPTQPWFAVLLSLLFRRPIILPNHPSLLRNPLNEAHPLIHQLNLAVWPVSGLPLKVREFQKGHQRLFYPPGGKQLRQHTHAAGGDGSSGVSDLDTALFVPL